MATDSRIATRDPQAPQARGFAAPPCDVYENEDELLLVADLPGVIQEGLDIQLDRDELRIEARRSPDQRGATGPDGHPPRDWRRIFTVPDGIDADAVKAELEAGVLYVHLPKAPDVRPRRISIQAA